MKELLEVIENGVDLNHIDKNGMTHLMKAASHDDINILKLILKYSDQLNTKDKFGNTALYYATKANKVDNVKLLHQSGAKITDEIYMLALHNGFKNIVEYFDRQDPIKRILAKGHLLKYKA